MKKKKMIILIAALVIILLGSIASIFSRPYIIARQQIPQEEKIVKVLRADTTGDGQKEILAAASRIVIDKTATGKELTPYNAVDIHVIQRLGPKDTKKWRLSGGEEVKEIFVEDINKDGKNEVVVIWQGGHLEGVILFIWNGSIYKKIFEDGGRGKVEIKDINNDGIKEILVGDRDWEAKEIASKTNIYKWDGEKYYLYKTEKIKT